MKIFSILLLLSVFLTAEQKPLMFKTGDTVTAKTFDSKDEVDKKTMGFRKETKYKVEEGIFKAIPPKIAYAGNPPEKSKWAQSSFARVTFANMPQEYAASVRVKFNSPADPKAKSKGRAYFDMGHRNIRVTMTTESTALVLSNHLLGKESDEKERILAKTTEVKLEWEKWYDVTMEVKGNEVVFQINNTKLYGCDELIKKERPANFNIDQSGAGFEVEKISIWKAAEYSENWETVKKELKADSKK